MGRMDEVMTPTPTPNPQPETRNIIINLRDNKTGLGYLIAHKTTLTDSQFTDSITNGYFSCDCSRAILCHIMEPVSCGRTRFSLLGVSEMKPK